MPTQHQQMVVAGPGAVPRYVRFCLKIELRFQSFLLKFLSNLILYPKNPTHAMTRYLKLLRVTYQSWRAHDRLDSEYIKTGHVAHLMGSLYPTPG